MLHLFLHVDLHSTSIMCLPMMWTGLVSGTIMQLDESNSVMVPARNTSHSAQRLPFGLLHTAITGLSNIATGSYQHCSQMLSVLEIIHLLIICPHDMSSRLGH